MEKFKVIELDGKKLVLKRSSRKPSMQSVEGGQKIQIVPLPNYGNTGMCLCGILKPGQSIEEFSVLYQLKKKGYSK